MTCPNLFLTCPKMTKNGHSLSTVLLYTTGKPVGKRLQKVKKENGLVPPTSCLAQKLVRVQKWIFIKYSCITCYMLLKSESPLKGNLRKKKLSALKHSMPHPKIIERKHTILFLCNPQKSAITSWHHFSSNNSKYPYFSPLFSHFVFYFQLFFLLFSPWDTFYNFNVLFYFITTCLWHYRDKKILHTHNKRKSVMLIITKPNAQI